MVKKYHNSGWIFVLALLVLQISNISCVSDPEDGLGCPYPALAELDSIHQVFYSPYINQRYSRQTDTVSYADFLLTAEFGFTNLNANTNAYERTYPGACPMLYHVQNVSNIELYLTSPFNGLSTGTEVSYLFELQDGTTLNRFRDFKRMNQYLSLRLRERPKQKSQINTRLVVYFRDGSSKSLESHSPFIK